MIASLSLLVVERTTECAPTRRDGVALTPSLFVPILVCGSLGPVRAIGPVALDAFVVICYGMLEVSRDGVVMLHLRQLQVACSRSFAALCSLRPLI